MRGRAQRPAPTAKPAMPYEDCVGAGLRARPQGKTSGGR